MEVFVVRINLDSGKTAIIHDGFLYELNGNKLENPVEVLDINDFKDMQFENNSSVELKK